VADGPFLASIQERGQAGVLAGVVRKVRVTQSVYDAALDRDPEHELAGLLVPFTPDPALVEKYQREMGLDAEEAATLAVGRRNLAQRLLATHSVFLVEEGPLAVKLAELEAEVVGSEEFVGRFGGTVGAGRVAEQG
jgi:hypothetical protein